MGLDEIHSGSPFGFALANKLRSSLIMLVEVVALAPSSR